MKIYYRPIIQNDKMKPSDFYQLGDQRQWFDKVEVIERGKDSFVTSADNVPTVILKTLTDTRSSENFGSFNSPLIMGILNITPDSFSDGGENLEVSKALYAVMKMISHGVDIIDVGGESTRPGSVEITHEEELSRIEPVLRKIQSQYPNCKVSVDTRKSNVMAQVMELGVNFINDVSAMTFDRKSRGVLANKNAQICLMHGGLNPQKMQETIYYNDVLLDVYDYLEDCINFAVEGGIKRKNIIIDPGIGFGKTTEQNVTLIRNASLFHSLGCPVLYGVSRKSFIGHIGKISNASNRFPGSIAVALELIRQGVQLIRVHDVKETRQAFDLWEAIGSLVDSEERRSV